MFRSVVVFKWLIVTFVSSACLGSNSNADVKLAGVFTDHMVLQRDSNVAVWGWAEPGEEISIKLGAESVSTKTNSAGKFMAKIRTSDKPGPHALIIAGKNQIVLKDVLFGEVWLCSGQSNMGMKVSGAQNFEAEKATANFPNIRMYQVAAHATPEPQSDCSGKWVVCAPETVGGFSATAYFFGRNLNQTLDVPVGLINTSWGGTDVAAWTSLPAQKAVEAIVPKLKIYDATISSYDPELAAKRYEKSVAAWETKRDKAKQQGGKIPRKPKAPIDPRVNQNRPANLFNGMVQPLIPYTIQGAIWYQGERNSHSIADGVLYEAQLKTLINDWRSRWKQGDFQFITVQLPNFRTPQENPVETNGWVMVRSSELKSLRLPNTGIAITTDIGMEGNIHPINKQEVGRRLALWALGTTYDKEDLTYSGPLFSSLQYKSSRVTPKGEMKVGSASVSFLHTGEGLSARDGGEIKGFAVAGEDGVFHHARATTDGFSVTLTSDQVADPVAVRYGWAQNPNCNLVNSAGLPASPFRTDSYELVEGK